MTQLLAHKALRCPGLILVLAAVASSTICSASDTIAPGWDLLQTDPSATDFFGHPFEGVPLGTYDFDSSIGVKNVGLADTVIRRVGMASVSGPGQSDTIPTAVDAFQLRSVGEVSIMGGPLGIYYITLQSLHGGPASAGSMTINFGPEGDPHGTFSSAFDLFVDIRLNSLTGTIIGSEEIRIADSGSTDWRHAPTGPIQIPGVNVDLGGANSTANDFWIEGDVSKDTPNGEIGESNAGVPDTANTFLMLIVTLVGFGFRKRAKRA